MIAFKESFKGAFKNFQTTFKSQIDLELLNIEDISETLSIPVKEIVKQETYRFSGNTFGVDILTLDINKYFTTLTVTCKDYVSIDEYLAFFAKFVDFLLEKNDYLSIKRIGLRKIGGKIFFNIDDIFNDFEKAYFNFDFSETDYNSLRNNHIDVLFLDEQNPMINYMRSFETGEYWKEEENRSVSAYQVILDIDGYYQETTLKSLGFEQGHILGLLENLNHEHLFNIFKMSVTEDFLNRNKRN